MYITVLPLLFTAATPPTHPEGVEQTGTNTAAGTYVCARVCLCVRVHECMCVGVLVSNCVFVHVNDLCLIASTCKYDLVFCSFKEVIIHTKHKNLL